MTVVGRTVDTLLEASVAGSFSRVGFVVRRRLEGWADLPRLDAKVFIVTGSSSGIGRATAIELARLGADVWLVGRDAARTEAAGRAAEAASSGGAIQTALLDVVDAAAVRSFTERFGRSHDRLDGLVHNAGALFPKYRTAPDGTELTVATHVLAPFRLSWFLSPLLQAARRSTIVTVASGGMYAERFDLDTLEMAPCHYKGARAYARAKRAQVVLSHEWARRWKVDGVHSFATHPGWVDTPGLATGLPSFTHLGPLLRSPDEGADTVVWLAADGPGHQVGDHDGSSATGEGFWHDRRRRGEYHLPGTRPRPGDAPDEGARLWKWCAARTGVGDDPEAGAPGRVW